MDDHGTLYCRYIDSINHRRLRDLDRFLARNVVAHTPDRSVGLETARQLLARWLAAVPDAHLVIEDLVVEGDHLMARLTATGTPRGSRTGEPIGARLSVAVFEAWRVCDGRCVECWLHIDRTECPPTAGNDG